MSCFIPALPAFFLSYTPTIRFCKASQPSSISAYYLLAPVNCYTQILKVGMRTHLHTYNVCVCVWGRPTLVIFCVFKLFAERVFLFLSFDLLVNAHYENLIDLKWVSHQYLKQQYSMLITSIYWQAFKYIISNI